MGEGRPHIPEQIKREVRQRCGFGCVFCGDMICDYEHIIDYAICRSHESENIVLLCVACHREVSSGRRDKGEVKERAMNPFCLVGKNHPSYKFLLKKSYDVNFAGGAVHLSEGDKCMLVAVNGREVFGFRIEDGIPLFSAELQDERGDTSFIMVDNVIEFSASSYWDAELSGSRFQVRYGAGLIFVDFEIRKSIFYVRSMKIVADCFPIVVSAYDVTVRTLFHRQNMAGNFLNAAGCGVVAFICIGQRVCRRNLFYCEDSVSPYSIQEAHEIAFGK